MVKMVGVILYDLSKMRKTGVYMHSVDTGGTKTKRQSMEKTLAV